MLVTEMGGLLGTADKGSRVSGGDQTLGLRAWKSETSARRPNTAAVYTTAYLELGLGGGERFGRKIQTSCHLLCEPFRISHADC